MISDKMTYDMVFIGGGAGGLFGASVANALGARTCLIDKTRLGGDCTWFGCMPSKALLRAGHVAHMINNSSVFGLKIKRPFYIETEGAMKYAQDVVSEIATHHPNEVFEKRGINVIIGSPKFIGRDSIEINGEKITAKKVVLCTGSHPVILPIEGLDEIGYFTNENIFELKKLPESLVVLGGGPIGVELSQALSRLGVKIKIVEMVDRILFREDEDISPLLEQGLIKEGIDVLTGKKAVKFKKSKEGIIATLENKKGERSEVSAENVLVAIGRAPNLEGLGLETAGVKYSKRGVEVNQYLQTTNKNIFACGDIVGPYMFSHVAAYQASICVRNALHRRIAWVKADYSNVVWATFTDPEVAHLGLTEKEARDVYKNVKVYKSDYSSVDRAVTDKEKEGLVKIITDNKGYLIGAHIVGAKAGELMQGFAIAKSLKIPVAKLAQVFYIYPSLSELVKNISAKVLVEKLNNPFIKLLLKIMRKKR